jgi:tetratricopeptide (TPR) repeat protein
MHPKPSSGKIEIDRMTLPTAHKWNFAPRLRRNAFGWRSQPAIARVKEAVAEIKKIARKDPVLAAEGAVLFLEKVSPALAHVDSSSGAIGTAVNNAIDVLASIIARAPADEATREKWLERLWKAVEDDDIPYIELLPEYWGQLCATRERASQWADSFVEGVKMSWDPSSGHHGYFKGTIACLSALLKAGRNEEVLALLELSPYKYWHYRKWGMKALSAMGRKAEAIRYAESNVGINDPLGAIGEACEEILLSGGMTDEAYDRYAMLANRGTSYLATFRAIAKKYPQKTAAEILHDLVGSSPGEEGKWFASARSAGLYDEAIELVNKTPCDPRTLTRAAKEAATEHPAFAVEAGMAALRWLCDGYGYEITSADIWAAYRHTMEAAATAGILQETHGRIRRLAQTSSTGFVAEVLSRELGEQ